MIFFASVSFIALPLTAFIYLDTLVMKASIDKKLQQLQQQEKKKDERVDPKVARQAKDDGSGD
jgi:hypothetical protein